MELSPDYIQENLQKLGRGEAFHLLKNWIENSQKSQIRNHSLRIMEKIDEGNHFPFYEQLFISDKDITVSITAGKILKNLYRNHPDFLPLLKYCLNQPTHIDITLFSMQVLWEMNKKKYQACSILTDFLKSLIDSMSPHNSSQLPDPLPLRAPYYRINEEVFNLCKNLALYKHYQDNCGYNVTMREGFIILLDCEGSNLKTTEEIPRLRELQHLQYLSLKRNKLSNLAGIPNLPNLINIDFSHNQIQKIDHLENQSGLEELNLSHNQIEFIANLNHQNNLKRLDLSHNKISKIENLAHLKTLKYLNLSHNQIQTIEHINGLIHLKKLNLSQNQIKKLQNLKNLPNLIWLYLTENHIEKIEGLGLLKELRGLLLSKNKIKTIEGLEKLENLRKLELSENYITKIEGLTHNKGLQELYLDKNNIKSLKGLGTLENLIILFLEQNEIQEFNAAKLEKLKSLDRFFLNDNPLSEESFRAYRKFKNYWKRPRNS